MVLPSSTSQAAAAATTTTTSLSMPCMQSKKKWILLCSLFLFMFSQRQKSNIIFQTTDTKTPTTSSSSFFPPQKHFDVFDPVDAQLIAKHYNYLITKKYKEELLYQWKRSQTFWKDQPNLHRCSGRVGMIESSLLYMMIREDQPKHVLEIGALCGTSTRWILEALETNEKNHGKLSTFDLHDFSMEYMDPKHTREGRWEFHHQDIFEYWITDEGKQMQKTIDLFFIDALHKNSFAQLYTKQLLGPHPHQTSVFVHDIYAPFLIPQYKQCQKNLTEDTYEEEMACITKVAKDLTAQNKDKDIFYGSTQAGGEGSELLSWLARTGRSYGLITASPYAAPDFAKALFASFRSIGLEFSNINNPAVLFELTEK